MLIHPIIIMFETISKMNGNQLGKEINCLLKTRNNTVNKVSLIGEHLFVSIDFLSLIMTDKSVILSVEKILK